MKGRFKEHFQSVKSLRLGIIFLDYFAAIIWLNTNTNDSSAIEILLYYLLVIISNMLSNRGIMHRSSHISSIAFHLPVVPPFLLFAIIHLLLYIFPSSLLIVFCHSFCPTFLSHVLSTLIFIFVLDHSFFFSPSPFFSTTLAFSNQKFWLFGYP